MYYSIKKILSVYLLACLSFSAFAGMKLETKKPKKKTSTGSKSMALGATLPKGVFRLNTVTFLTEFDSKRNAKGESESLGSKININGMAFALEYGATDSLSLQFKMPVMMFNKLSYDPNNIEGSVAYNKVVKKMGPPANATAKARYVAAVAQSFDKHTHGTKGIGDIEVGALYNWFSTDRILFSTGLGMRFPTGKYYAPIMQRPIGGGLFSLGLQNNLDFSFVDQNVWLSFRHEGEIAISRARVPVEGGTSALDGVLDDSVNETFRKEGLTHKVVMQSSGSFGALSHHLKFLSTSLGYQFDSKAPTVTKVADYASERSNNHSLLWNLSASALPYRIPLALDIDLKKPLAGKNAGPSETATAITFNVKAYFKF